MKNKLARFEQSYKSTSFLRLSRLRWQARHAMNFPIPGTQQNEENRNQITEKRRNNF